MNTNAIIKQLEKALSKKDDKELRLRVEVLVEILKETKPLPPAPMLPLRPTEPHTTYVDDTPLPATPYKITSNSNKINGSGPIVGGGEQINYTRPEGT